MSDLKSPTLPSKLFLNEPGGRGRRAALFLLALAISVLAITTGALAHEVRPTYLQIDQIGQGRFSVLWRTPLLSGVRLPVMLQFSEGIRPVTEPSECQLSDSVVERSMVEAAGGLPGKRITFVRLQATITDVLVRVTLEDGTVNTTLVSRCSRGSKSRLAKAHFR